MKKISKLESEIKALMKRRDKAELQKTKDKHTEEINKLKAELSSLKENHEYKNYPPEAMQEIEKEIEKVLFDSLQHGLNSTPCELKILTDLGTSCLRCAVGTRLAEQPARASLTSELADSALLGYLRRALLRERRRKRGKSLHHRQRKNTAHPNGYAVFLAEKERFELSRRYSRPTPLAGAPLHHLSTSPKMQGRFINLLDYYIKSARECQYLFIKKIKKEEDIGADPKYFAVLSLIFRN